MDTRQRGGGALAALVLAVAGVAFGLLIGEALLRVAGFQYHLMPTVQFGWPDPQTIASNSEDDPDLFWVTKDYRQKLHLARKTHPDVIFMGDSCTEFGHYPERAIEESSRLTGTAQTGVHLAAGGWTSEQGLLQLQRDVLPIHPHAIVVYYGWNDHWIALGPTDSQLERVRPWLQLAEHFRLAQVVLKIWVGRSSRNGDKPPRVPPDRYLSNLEAIAKKARDAGIVPILVTAPSNHIAGREPPYLQARHVNRLSDVVPLHTEYVDLTRRAANEEHAVLCDAFVALKARPDFGGLFRTDGIHFTDAGDVVLGQVVGQCIARALQHRS
jgi:lysophospholipase L1-like esterase